MDSFVAAQVPAFSAFDDQPGMIKSTLDCHSLFSFIDLWK